MIRKTRSRIIENCPVKSFGNLQLLYPTKKWCFEGSSNIERKWQKPSDPAMACCACITFIQKAGKCLRARQLFPQHVILN